jgi:hypothetical protein
MSLRAPQDTVWVGEIRVGKKRYQALLMFRTRREARAWLDSRYPKGSLFGTITGKRIARFERAALQSGWSPIFDAVLSVRVAVWDVINLVPEVHSPAARRRLKYAARKLDELVRATR